MVNPVIGSGKVIQQRGKLAAYKADLLAHRDGTGFRQNALSVDMSPQLTFFPDPTVQGTLEAMETFLLNDSAYVSIGDNSNSFGTFNVGASGYPTVESCFAGALATLRISYRGGVIQLKAGRYNFQSTVTLPQGVSVIGELGGTLINADSSNPIFNIEESDLDIIRYSAIKAEGSKQNKFYNLSFFDAFGSVSPNLSLSSFIVCDRGSNVRIERCSVYGKIGSTGSPPSTTRFFISYDTGTTSLSSSILNIENCYIGGIQQVVNFDVETARSNELHVRNNRIWVSGRLGAVPATNENTSAIAFRACSGNLSHNQFLFGLSLSTLQTVRSAFCCYDSGSAIQNLVIIGNQGKYSYSVLTNSDNRLLSQDNDGLQYIRSSVSDNVMGGASDSNWYLVVGDGVNSVGDINGEYALQNIVKYLYNMNLSGGHGGLIVYVKHGNYTIDDNSVFEPPASLSAPGLPVALIGLHSNGNFPTITFDVSVPDTNGQSMMFGHHIENIFFTGGSNYYRVIVRNDFANPDLRVPFFRNVVVKNCSFTNCSLGFLSASASSVTNEFMKNEVLIEGCQFSNTATISNLATPESMYAIEGSNKNGKIIIKECQTITGQWRGKFFTFDTYLNIDTEANCQLYIEDCVISSVNTDSNYNILARGIRGLYFVNNDIDLSSVPTTRRADGISAYFITDGNYEASCCIRNNSFISNNGNYGNYGITLSGVEKLEILENTFKGFYWGIRTYITYYGTTQTLHSLSYNINKNRLIADSKSYGFYFGETTHGGVLTNVLTGEINIYNNSLDYESQSTSFYTIPSISNMKSPIMLSVKSPITSGTDDIQVNIKDNKIRKFKGTLSTGVYSECCICVMGASSCKISGNDINYANTSASGQFNVIYSSTNGIGGTTYINAGTALYIEDNKIVSDGSTGGNESSIFARNLGLVTITNNTLRKSSGSNNLYNIKAYNEGDLSASQFLNMNGIISNNVFDILATYDLKLKDTSWITNAVRMTIGPNTNLSIEKEIDCTHFRPYAYNRNYGYSNGLEDSTLLWNKSTSIVSTFPNTSQIHIINDGLDGRGVASSSWTTLPDGLYWTNAVRTTSISPTMAISTQYTLSGSENQHQIIVPIDIPSTCYINSISIPIYLRNDSGSSQYFVAGAAAIVGNDVSRINELNSISPIGRYISNISDDIFLLTSSFTNQYFDNLTNTIDANPLPASLEMYVVISMYVAKASYSVASTPVNSFYYAIPHIKIQYTY